LSYWVNMLCYWQGLVGGLLSVMGAVLIGLYSMRHARMLDTKNENLRKMQAEQHAARAVIGIINQISYHYKNNVFPHLDKQEAMADSDCAASAPMLHLYSRFVPFNSLVIHLEHLEGMLPQDQFDDLQILYKDFLMYDTQHDGTQIGRITFWKSMRQVKEKVEDLENIKQVLSAWLKR